MAKQEGAAQAERSLRRGSEPYKMGEGTAEASGCKAQTPAMRSTKELIAWWEDVGKANLEGKIRKATEGVGLKRKGKDETVAYEEKQGKARNTFMRWSCEAEQITESSFEVKS